MGWKCFFGLFLWGLKRKEKPFSPFLQVFFSRTYLGDANFAGRLLLHLPPPFGSGGVPFKRRRVSHFIFASPSAAGNLIEKGEEEAGKPDRTFCNTFPPSLRQAKVKEALWLPLFPPFSPSSLYVHPLFLLRKLLPVSRESILPPFQLAGGER